MSFWKVLCAVALLTGVVEPLLAQEEAVPPETILPEIPIPPPEEPVLDKVEMPPTSAAPELSLAFPSLSNLQIGQPGPLSANTGVLRSEGSIFDTERAVGIVTRQRIEENQAADMFEALQNEVGVLMQSTAAGQASPFVRGLTGQQAFGACNQHRLSVSLLNVTDQNYLVHGSGVFGTGFTGRVGYRWVY